MTALEELAAILGPDMADLVERSHRETLQAGIQLGFRMAADVVEKSLPKYQANGASEAQLDMARGILASLRDIGPEFGQILRDDA